MRSRLTPVLVLAMTAGLANAADPEPRWRTLNRDARVAIQAGDYAKVLGLLLELGPLLPGNVRIAYNLAVAEAKLGNAAAAVATLRRLASMGLIYDLAADNDFSGLRESPEFRAVLKKMDENRKSMMHSSEAFALAEADLLPEDIAFDPKTRRYFISSVRTDRVITTDGKLFARTPMCAFALRVDAARRILWVSTGGWNVGESFTDADKDKTALMAFDLDSGELKQRVDSPVAGLFGDMTISRGGDLYVSEGTYGAVFRLPAGGAKLERIDTPGEFASPQTPVLSADERLLYVPDYVRGIAAMDLKSGKVEWLQPAADIALSGIDGLYLHRGSFIAVQNGTSPPRVIRFSSDLIKQEVLEANWDGLGEPTHGTFVGDDFLFIANGGWPEYDRDGKKKAGSAPVRSVIRKMTLR
jgi:sugar lactone lactonase YvrE